MRYSTCRSTLMVAALAALAVLGCQAAACATEGGTDLWVRTGANSLQIRRGIGITGGLGKLPTVQVMQQVAAASTNYVLSATAIPSGAATTTVITTGIESPDWYRNVTITGSAAAATSKVVIHGTSWDGLYQTETITGNGAATVPGNKPFMTVTKIAIYGVQNPGGATYSVGIGQKLGLYRPIALDTDVVCIDHKTSGASAWTAEQNGSLPSGASVNVAYGTVQPEATIGANKAYKIYYNALTW